jgi:hypothetical protein
MLGIISIYAMEKEEEPKKITVRLQFNDQEDAKEYTLEENIFKSFLLIKETLADVGDEDPVPLNITRDQFTHTLDFINKCTSFTLSEPKARYAQQRQAQAWVDTLKKQSNYLKIIDDISTGGNYLMGPQITNLYPIYAKELLSNPQFIKPNEFIEGPLKNLYKQQYMPSIIQTIKGLPTLIKFQKQEQPDEWSQKFYKKKFNPFTTIISPQKQYYATFREVVGKVDIYSIVDDSFEITLYSLGEEPTAIAFDAYGTSIVVGDRYGGIKKYTIQENPTAENMNMFDPEYKIKGDRVDYISVCPSDNTIIAYGRFKTLAVLYNDIDTNKENPKLIYIDKELCEKDFPPRSPYCINFTPDGKWLVALYQYHQDLHCTRWSTTNDFQKDHGFIIPWEELIKKIAPQHVKPDSIKSIKPFLTDRSCYVFSLKLYKDLGDYEAFVLFDFRNKNIMVFEENQNVKQRAGNLLFGFGTGRLTPSPSKMETYLSIKCTSINTVYYNNSQNYIPYFDLDNAFFNANETILNLIQRTALDSYSIYDNCWQQLFDTLEKTDFDLQTLHTLYQNYLTIVDNNNVSDITALLRLSAGIPMLRNQIFNCLSAKQKALFYAGTTKEKVTQAVSAIASIPKYTQSAFSAAKIAAAQKLKQIKPSATVEQPVIPPAAMPTQPIKVEQPIPQIKQAPVPMQPMLNLESIEVHVPEQQLTFLQRIGQGIRSIIDSSAQFVRSILYKVRNRF